MTSTSQVPKSTSVPGNFLSFLEIWNPRLHAGQASTPTKLYPRPLNKPYPCFTAKQRTCVAQNLHHYFLPVLASGKDLIPARGNVDRLSFCLWDRRMVPRVSSMLCQNPATEPGPSPGGQLCIWMVLWNLQHFLLLKKETSTETQSRLPASAEIHCAHSGSHRDMLEERRW